MQQGAASKGGEPVFEHLRPTVADALPIPVEQAMEVPRYVVGEEPTERPDRTRKPPSPYLKAEEVDAILKDRRREAKAGIPDPHIARRTGLSKDQVARWRRRLGIRREPGRPRTAKRLAIYAVEVFGKNEPVAVPVDSPVGGRFEPPQYLLRVPLDYAAFAQICFHLMNQGFQAHRIAQGLGMQLRDVLDAAMLWEARGQK